MATDLEKLVVQLSADIRSFDKELARMNGVTNRQFAAIERRARQLNKNLDGIFARSFKGLASPLAGVGAVLGTAELARLADTWSDLNSRVRLAAGSIEQGEEVMDRLGEVARRTYSSLEQTAEGYLANATTLKELGYSTNQTLDFTESLNNALVVSGAKGQRAASVMEALSKAMALGKLSGDNLNTVIASGGRVAEALAAGLGVGVNQLRALGAQGKITGRDVVQALSSQMATLRKEAEAMPATISDGIQLLRNALLEYVGNGDQATGVSAKISEALVIMADNFDTTADVALQLAAVIAGALIGRSLLKMISTLGLAGSALVKFTQALAAARTMGGLAAAMGGLGAVAGPVGLIIGGAVVASLVAFSSATADASGGARTYAEALEEVERRAEGVAEKVENASQAIDEKKKNQLAAGLEEAKRAADEARMSVDGLFEHLFSSVNLDIVPPEQIRQLEDLRKGLNDGTISAEDAERAIYKLANSNPNFQAVANSFSPLLTTLWKAIAAVDLLQGKMDAMASASSFRALDDASMRSYEAMKATNQAFIDSQTKQNALSKQQLAIETEIAKVKKAAAEAGAVLTEKQIRDIATANVAANDRRSSEGKKTAAPKKTADDRFDNLTQQIQDRIAAMRIEAEVTGLVYQEQEKRRMALELEQEALKIVREEARKKGDQDWQNAKLSPEQIAKINEMSEAYAQQAEALRLIEEAQGRAENAANEFYDSFKSGMIGALKGAESFSDALSKILKKLADMVLNSAFDSLFNGASSSGGWLTGIFKGLGFSEGGWTGPGPKNKPAGVVHAGEVVWSQDDIRKAGGVAAVEAMRKGMGGMAMPASIQAPTMPKLSNMGGGAGTINAPVYINIDATGSDREGLMRVEQQVAKLRQEVPSMVISNVRKAQKSNVKLG